MSWISLRRCDRARWTFGLAEAEALGQSLDIIPERLRARHWERFFTTIQTGQSRHVEGQTLSVPAIRNGGTQISVEFTIVPFTDYAEQRSGSPRLCATQPPRSRHCARWAANSPASRRSLSCNAAPGADQQHPEAPADSPTPPVYSIFRYFIPKASAHSAMIRFRIELASPPA
jgi:hypothetical protein